MGTTLKDALLFWMGTAFLASLIVLIFFVTANPFLIDTIPLALLVFVALPAVIGAAVGLLVGSIRAVIARVVSRAGTVGAGRRDPQRRARRSLARHFFVTALGLLVVAIVVCWGLHVKADRGPSEPGLKLLIVGLDGMTWDIAGPMLQDRRLPAIEAALEKGTGGTLASLKPLYSTRIFTSIASGKMADKHGIRGLSDTRADDVLVMRIWEVLEKQLDWDYGLVEWYLTWPPAASSGGFCVPGILAMTNETIPPELGFIKKLRRQGKDIRERGAAHYIGIALGAARNGARLSTLADLVSLAVVQRSPDTTPLDVYARQQEALVRIITDATCHRLRRSEVQMLALIYKGTDSVSHKYWRFHEPSAFPGMSADGVDRYGTAIEDIYTLADSQLARLERYVADDGIVVLVSDHGFQANKTIGSQMVSFRTQVLLEALGFSVSDVSYVNLGGSFYLQPLSLNSAENERVRSELEAVFTSLSVEDDGAAAFYVRNVDNEGTGDDYVEVTVTPELQQAAPGDPLLVGIGGRAVRISEFLSVLDISGAHDMDGVVVFTGPPFVQGGDLTNASVLDIVPTILAALGLPVADDMDGRVLTEALNERFLSSTPVEAVPTYETEIRIPRRSTTLDEMPEETKEQLRSLGYIQ